MPETEIKSINGRPVCDDTAREAIVGKQDALNVSGASVGQYLKVASVDGSGKPTSWEAGTPSGGGGSITEFETEDADELEVDQVPTRGSQHLVTSGGVYSAIQNAGSGLSSEAAELLIAILQAGTYGSDQTDNIDALEELLAVGGNEPEPEPEYDIEQFGSVLKINAAPATKVGSVLKIV